MGNKGVGLPIQLRLVPSQFFLVMDDASVCERESYLAIGCINGVSTWCAKSLFIGTRIDWIDVILASTGSREERNMRMFVLMACDWQMQVCIVLSMECNMLPFYWFSALQQLSLEYRVQLGRVGSDTSSTQAISGLYVYKSKPKSDPDETRPYKQRGMNFENPYPSAIWNELGRGLVCFYKGYKGYKLQSPQLNPSTRSPKQNFDLNSMKVSRSHQSLSQI